MIGVRLIRPRFSKVKRMDPDILKEGEKVRKEKKKRKLKKEEKRVLQKCAINEKQGK